MGDVGVQRAMRTEPARRSAGAWIDPSATSRSRAPIIPSQLEKVLVVPWPVMAWPLRVLPDMSSCSEVVSASLFIALTFGLFRAVNIEAAPKPRPRTLTRGPLDPYPESASARSFRDLMPSFRLRRSRLYLTRPGMGSPPPLNPPRAPAPLSPAPRPPLGLLVPPNRPPPPAGPRPPPPS